MRKNLLYLAIILLLASATFVIKTCKVVDALRNENEMHRRNEKTFVEQVEHYKTQNGLAGAKVNELELKLTDALKVIDEDKKTISNLNIKIKDMAQASKASIKTEFKVVQRLQDSTCYKHDTVFRDTTKIKYVDVVNPYYDVHAIIVHDTINMDIVTRDSLLIIETVKYKRFLGFLWKTKRVKERTFDVVSKNPNTIIEDFRVVTVRK